MLSPKRNGLSNQGGLLVSIAAFAALSEASEAGAKGSSEKQRYPYLSMSGRIFLCCRSNRA